MKLFYLLLCMEGIFCGPIYHKYEFEVSRNVQVVAGRTLVVNKVNGNVLGPAIHVARGNSLSVKVINMLPDQGLSIHWHGLEMRNSQIFDGVVGVTQCAIGPGESFTYDFVVDEEPGTYWWHTHSHDGGSAVGHNFVKGPMIIYENDDDINSLNDENQYSLGNDRILFYQDLWPNFMAFDQAQTMGGLNIGADPDAEGYGIGPVAWTSGIVNGEQSPFVKVTNGEYKFRVINGGGQFAYLFSIDEHTLTVVATDGSPVEPFQTDVVQINTGERYDVLVNFDVETAHNVFIRAKTLSVQRTTGIFATLQIKNVDAGAEYLDTPATTEPVDYTTANILNCVWYNNPANCIPVTALTPLSSRPLLPTEIHVADSLFEAPPHYSHFVALDYKVYTQNAIPEKAMIAESFNLSSDLHPHTLVMDLPLDKSVTLVFRSATTFPHPIHMHGHKFEVLEIVPRVDPCQYLRCPLMDLKTAFSVPLEELSARMKPGVLKDTFILPSGGAVAVRFNTDNPGVWLVHCHLDTHQEDGQSFIIHEGGYRESTFPADYPSCDYTGRIQYLREAACNCYEDTSTDERWRIKSTWKCSKPHLCRHVGVDTGNSGHSGQFHGGKSIEVSVMVLLGMYVL